MKEINDLVALSQQFGAQSEWVVAGGGNTSWKNSQNLWVKASGHALATITPQGFAVLDQSQLKEVMNSSQKMDASSVSVKERESQALEAIMRARIPGEKKRPSVETLLHHLLPWPFVVHLHPTLTNGLVCSHQGQHIMEQLFGPSALWIPPTDPGMVLARMVQEKLHEKPLPDYIFLANHGVFAGGKNVAEVQEKYSRLKQILVKALKRPQPSLGELPPMQSLQELERIHEFPLGFTSMLQENYGAKTQGILYQNQELLPYLESPQSAQPLTGSLTPDHIVYSGPGALYLGSQEWNLWNGDVTQAWCQACQIYRAKWGRLPQVTLFHQDWAIPGALILGNQDKGRLAALLFQNALEICLYAQSFGGAKPLDDSFVHFIVNWEAENYRQQVAHSSV